MIKQIKVTINQLGNPKIEAEGFVGSTCDVATDPIEKMFIGEDANSKKKYKDTYYEQSEQNKQYEQY